MNNSDSKNIIKQEWFISNGLDFNNIPQPIDDWRLIDKGSIIPTCGGKYADQPYIIQTDDGAWLCTVTTGQGREGQSGPYR